MNELSPVTINTPTALEVMIRVMDNENLKYKLSENRITARFPAGAIRVELSMRFTEAWVFFFIRFNVFAPEDRRDLMGRFINQTNWDLNLGNLEMDPVDGEIRLRYSYALNDELLSNTLGEYLMYRMLHDADNCASGILNALVCAPSPPVEEACSAASN